MSESPAALMAQGSMPTRGRSAAALARSVLRRAAHLLLASLLLATLIVPRQGNAHHSIAAFDASRMIELTGTLTSAKIANPHSVFHVAARDAEGRVTDWTIEGAGAATVLREVRGGRPDRFAAGQAVTVTFMPARDGKATGNLVSLRFADGQVLNGIRVP